MSELSKRELSIRRAIRICAWITVVIGVIFSSIRFYDLAQLVMVDAKVTDVRSQPGRCRVPVGKYIDCNQSLVVVSYIPLGATSEKTGEILVEARGATIKAGDDLKIAYNVKTPDDIILPDIEKFLRGPLGMILVGFFFAGMERLTR